MRKLCEHCKTPHKPNEQEYQLMHLTADVDLSQICEPQGCDHCNNLGYRGRTGIYEIIPLDDTLRKMIHHQESLHTIEEYLRPHIPSIRDDGFKRVLQGDTSIAEVLRVTSASASI